MNKENFKYVALVALVLAVIGGWFYFSGNPLNPPAPEPTVVTTPVTHPEPSEPVLPVVEESADALFQSINLSRETKLVSSPKLNLIAERRAAALKEFGPPINGKPSNEWLEQRLNDAGYKYSKVYELVALGHQNVSLALRRMLRDHKSKITDVNITEVGVAVLKDPTSTWKTYYVVVLATPVR